MLLRTQSLLLSLIIIIKKIDKICLTKIFSTKIYSTKRYVRQKNIRIIKLFHKKRLFQKYSAQNMRQKYIRQNIMFGKWVRQKNMTPEHLPEQLFNTKNCSTKKFNNNLDPKISEIEIRQKLCSTKIWLIKNITEICSKIFLSNIYRINFFEHFVKQFLWTNIFFNSNAELFNLLKMKLSS